MSRFPTLSARTRARALFRVMARIRAFEETVEAAAARNEIRGPVHLSIGQEAVAAGVCLNLARRDLITSTHRGHGHALAKGADVERMMAELFGRARGLCGGKGGSMHVADFSVGMLGANGVVADGVPIAAGAAHALKLKKSKAVVACFFGDGAINRGPLLEGMNWAKVFALPVLFVCEDNGYSATTRTGSMTAGAGVMARSRALDIPGLSVDGNDAEAVDRAARRLLAEVRAGKGPRLLHARTTRVKGHIVQDQGAYRAATDAKKNRARDPMIRLGRRLVALGLAPAAVEADAAHARAEMARAAQKAQAAPRPKRADAFTDVQDAGDGQWL